MDISLMSQKLLKMNVISLDESQAILKTSKEKKSEENSCFCWPLEGIQMAPLPLTCAVVIYS